MSDASQQKPPIEPLKSYIEGLGIPGAVILVCAAIGAGLAVWNGKGGEAFEWARNGGYLGAFLSLFGIGEMIGGLLGGSNRFMNGVYAALGYLTTLALGFVVLAAFG